MEHIVIWSSGIGAATAAIGLVIGIWIMLPSRRVPYAGQKRWHAILGLIFGFFACTWAFSGMLSMEPFTFSAGPQRLGGRIQRALRRIDLESNKPIPHGARIVEFNPLAGDTRAVLDAVRQAVAPASIVEIRTVTKYEAYYLDRRGQHPLPALFVRLNDARDSMFYIDPAAPAIVEAYDSASRWNRWLCHGLHSLDLPWLYAHRPAWDIVVLVLLAGGASLSVTSFVLGWRVLRRSFF